MASTTLSVSMTDCSVNSSVNEMLLLYTFALLMPIMTYLSDPLGASFGYLGAYAGIEVGCLIAQSLRLSSDDIPMTQSAGTAHEANLQHILAIARYAPLSPKSAQQSLSIL